MIVSPAESSFESDHAVLRWLPRGHHHPDRAGSGELADQVFERGSAGRAFLDQRGDVVLVVVEHDALVLIFEKAAHHVGTHPAEADHSELHNMERGKRLKLLTLTMIVHPPPGACVSVGEHQAKLEAPERFAEPFAEPAAGNWYST